MNPDLMNRYILDALGTLNQSNAALRLVLDYSDDGTLNAALEAVLAADRAAAGELRRVGQAQAELAERARLADQGEED